MSSFCRLCAYWPTSPMETLPRNSLWLMMICSKKSNIIWYSKLVPFSRCLFALMLLHFKKFCCFLCFRVTPMWSCSWPPPSASPTSSGMRKMVRSKLAQRQRICTVILFIVWVVYVYRIWAIQDCLFLLALGSQERQDKLREMGFVDILHKLSQVSDPNLCDR